MREICKKCSRAFFLYFEAVGILVGNTKVFDLVVSVQGDQPHQNPVANRLPDICIPFHLFMSKFLTV